MPASEQPTADQRGWTLVELTFLIAILAFWGGSLWILFHFVRKFW